MAKARRGSLPERRAGSRRTSRSAWQAARPARRRLPARLAAMLRRAFDAPEAVRARRASRDAAAALRGCAPRRGRAAADRRLLGHRQERAGQRAAQAGASAAGPSSPASSTSSIASVPFAARGGRLSQLDSLVLAESPDVLETGARRLRDALGRNGKLIADLVPELELVIGPPAACAGAGAGRSQARFELVFRQFLQVFARSEHPLALFLDDLQWADAASLRLLRQVLAGGSARTCSSSAPTATTRSASCHPLLLTLDDLRKAGVARRRARPRAAQVETSSRCWATPCTWTRAAVRPLAEILVRKTDGNPFFLQQFLTALREQKLLRSTPSAAAGLGSMPGPGRRRFRQRRRPAGRADSPAVGRRTGSADIGRLHRSGVRARHVVSDSASAPGRAHRRDHGGAPEGLLRRRSTRATASSPKAHPKQTRSAKVLSPVLSLLARPRPPGGLRHRRRRAARSGPTRAWAAPARAGPAPSRATTSCSQVVRQLNLGLTSLTRRRWNAELARFNLRAGVKVASSGAHGSALELLRRCLDILGPTHGPTTTTWHIGRI